MLKVLILSTFLFCQKGCPEPWKYTHDHFPSRPSKSNPIDFWSGLLSGVIFGGFLGVIIPKPKRRRSDGKYVRQ